MPLRDANGHRKMTDSSLSALFAQLADDELCARVASGGLTAEALAIASAELSARGLVAPLPLVPAQDAPREYLGDMVILARRMTPTEAHLLCSRLQAAGVQADAGDTNIVQANALLSIAVGGASVRVPSHQLAEAREVMAALRRGDFALGDDFDPGVEQDA